MKQLVAAGRDDHLFHRQPAFARGLPVGRPVSGIALKALIGRGLSSVPDPVVKAYLAFTGLKADD